MNVLVTGARAPISADIARALAVSGHRVWVADSLRWPLGAASPFVEGAVRLPSPRANFPKFSERLGQACRELSLDVIVPTSEEIFWLAAAAPNLPGVNVRTSPLSLLERLHHKGRFAELAAQLGHGAAEAREITDAAELAKIGDPSAFVFKPVYSRFATRTLIAPSRRQLEKIRPTPAQPWLAQSLVHGREFCLYNVAANGRLLLHVAYEPRLRFGVGAGIYFAPIIDSRLRELSERFIAATGFDGQISFDVIDTGRELVALECNPRGTSGAHLAAQQPELFSAALLGRDISSAPAAAMEARTLFLPLFLSHPGLWLQRQGRALLRAAKDANAVAGISAFAQMRAMLELSFVAARSGRSLAAASTADIEWNGEPIHG